MTLNEELLTKIREDKDMRGGAFSLNNEFSDLIKCINYAYKSQYHYDIKSLSALIEKSYEKGLLPSSSETKQGIEYPTEILFNKTEPRQNFKYSIGKLLCLYTDNSEKKSINYWLAEKHISVKELIERTHYSRKSLFDFRNGYLSPKYRDLLKIAEALDVPVYKLKGSDQHNKLK